MKLVCWGMWLAPLHARVEHPLVEQRAAPSASPRLPAAGHRRRARGSRASSSRAALAPPARAPPPAGPRASSSCSSATRAQRRDVDALGQRDAGVLERARQLGVHQAVEAQLAEPAAELHVGAAAARDAWRRCRAARRPGPPRPPPPARPWSPRSCAAARAISAATSRRLIDRLAVLGRSPSQKCRPRTRFQIGRSVDTLRKCSSTFARHLGRATAPDRARGRATTAHATCSPMPSGTPTTDSSLMNGLSR